MLGFVTSSRGGPPMGSPGRRRLQTVGALVLAIGLTSAGLTYWLGTRNASPSVVDLMPGTARVIARQRGILYGRSGAVLLEWMDDLRDPQTQAVLIGVASVVISALCFHAATMPEDDVDLS